MYASGVGLHPIRHHLHVLLLLLLLIATLVAMLVGAAAVVVMFLAAAGAAGRRRRYRGAGIGSHVGGLGGQGQGRRWGG